MSRMAVFSNLMKDIKVAAVMPTSSFSVKRLCRKMDPAGARVVVEYGPGTGPFTRFLLDRMPEDSKLILIETNDNFCSMLKDIDDDRVHVYKDTAQNVKQVLADCGEDRADYVISGIPFTLVGDTAKKEILESTRDILSDNGKFLVYQHSSHLKKHLVRYFENVKTDLAVLNLPPLVLFEAHN